jgi:hypothetical protein
MGAINCQEECIVVNTIQYVTYLYLVKIYVFFVMVKFKWLWDW